MMQLWFKYDLSLCKERPPGWIVSLLEATSVVETVVGGRQAEASFYWVEAGRSWPGSPARLLGRDRDDSQRTAGSANDFQWCCYHQGASRRKLIKVRETRQAKLAAAVH